jgi:glycine/D-amino acid oxidase-like deaminating enzyme
MLNLVHPDSLHFDTPVDSYWEASADALGLQLPPLRSDTTCDVAIIGGGFTGLSAAIELAEQGLDVCVLEAGHIGWGASGRNGGFACIGAHKLGYAKMIQIYGLDATKHFYSAMKAGVELVADNASRHNIDIWQQDNGEITLAHRPDRFQDFYLEQTFYRETFGEENEVLTDAELKERGLYSSQFHGGLLGPVGFGIHPLNYVRGLARAAHRVGAKLYPKSRVTLWQQEDGSHRLYTEQGQVTAKRVLVATNGYTPENLSPLHKGRILPALSNIIVTRPLSDNELKAQGWTAPTLAYDSRNLLHYFRLLPDKRFLFGGRGGTDSSHAASDDYRQELTGRFHQMFPAWRDAGITHFWRGFVCLAKDRVPYVGPLNDAKTVWTALAYHGNGVATGSWCGRAVAHMMLDKTARHEVPAVLTRRLARFPLPMFRPLYLKGAYVWYGWQDGK